MKHPSLPAPVALAPSTSGLPAPTGLTSVQAAARLATDGGNALPRARQRSRLRIVWDVMREPMLALLLAGGGVYLLLGNRAEALILLAFAGLSVTITVVQETRTERVLAALRDLTSPRALVIRDGAHQRIAGREVVRGDLLVLSEGDRVAADAWLITAQGLLADESLLTGEAVAVRKQAGLAPVVQNREGARAGGDDQPMVYSGSLIVGGTALAQVTATGPASEIGRIGAALGQLDFETPALQRQLRKLVIGFGAVGLAVSLTVVVLYGLWRGTWLDGVLPGIAVGMSMLPEEFPMVLTVFMAMGAWRISQARVLTRRASAIETLGAASVLCTDKTGTLTENRMTIAALSLPGGPMLQPGPGLPDKLRELVAAGAMACAPEPYDPMEKAFHALGGADLRAGETPPGAGRHLARSYALTPDLLAMSQAWSAPADANANAKGDSAGWQIAAKGAPEEVADLCRLSARDRAALALGVERMAKTGLRVLAVAEAAAPGPALPDSQRAFRFRLLGLVGLRDPLRASVPGAIADCRSAGIRVIMITGDYPATALAIAAEAGLKGKQVITGTAMAELGSDDLASAVRDCDIFARIMPEQKLRIILALKAAGAVVAMTGDGVNDAPSLKAAHIGVAMGGRGTDVAREAAAIVLLDDDFGAIVTTIRLGRRIYDNLRKAMQFILAVHVPLAGLALMPLLAGMPLLFGPVHIAFLEMIIDPVCALVFEAETEEEGIMARPPRPIGEPLFSGAAILWSLFQGGLVLAVTGAIFALTPVYGLSTDQGRGLTFAALVCAIVALILVDRSGGASIRVALTRPNRALVVVVVGVAAMLAGTLLWQPARALFGFAALEPLHLVVPPLVGLGVLVVLEAAKRIWRRPRQRVSGQKAPRD